MGRVARIVDTPAAIGRLASGLCVCLVLLSATSTGALAAQAGARVEPVSPCFVVPAKDQAVDFKYDCGYVVVPEDPSAASGPTVKLGFLRLKARAATKDSPLFLLAGGPGASLIEPTTFVLFGSAMLGSLLDTRDVVVLDQRGTKHSVPHLDCPEYPTLPLAIYSQGLNEAASIALERWVLERCIRDVRRRGIDLAKYNSVAIATDINAARQALGYDRIVLYGTSYGSQLSQHMTRDYPAALEAVILDGTNSLSRKSWIEDRALDVDYALGHLAELCRTGPKCREAYDIPALIERGLALFDAGPIAASYVDPKPPGARLDFDVRQKDFVALLYQLQESKYGVAGLPFVLNDLVKNGRASMAKGLGQILGPQLLQARSATSGAMATLMHYAVVCSDDPVRSVDELVLDGVRTRYAALAGRRFADEYVRSCDTLRVPSLPDSTDVDVTASIPTLILSGGLDVATPTYRSEIVARSLPGSRLVVFPGGTHVQLGAINLCAAQITVAFVRNPSAALPLKCVGETPFPGFVLPDGTVGR